MEIKVSQLRDALELAKPAVPRKPTLEVLKNVMVKDGKLMATDLESMVIVDMPEADGGFLLPYREVLEMLKYVPGYDSLEIKAEKKMVILSWPDGEANYPTAEVDDFPPIPGFEPRDEADIDGDAFIAALNSALPYAATKEDRPVLTGVTVLFGGPVEVAAGDGFRMAHIVLPFQFPAEYTTIIPAGAVKTLAHVMAKTPRPGPRGDDLVDIVLAKRQLHVGLDGKQGLMFTVSPTVSVLVKLIEGNPPDWLRLIPREEPAFRVQFLSREMETAARRVRDVANQGGGIIRIEFNDENAIISARSDDRKVSATVRFLEVQGAPNRVALNVHYLMDYLGDKGSIVTMSGMGDSSPISFQHSNSPRVIVMPMMVDWGKPLPGEETAEAAPDTPAEEIPEEPSPEVTDEEEEIPEAIEENAPEASVEEEPEAPKPKKRRGKKSEG